MCVLGMCVVNLLIIVVCCIISCSFLFFVTMRDTVYFNFSNENKYLEWNNCQYFTIISCSIWVQSLVGMHMHHSKVASSQKLSEILTRIVADAYDIFKTSDMLFALSSLMKRNRHLSIS